MNVYSREISVIIAIGGLAMSHQTIQASIVVNAPVDLVWEVVNDPATYVEGIDWVYEAWREEDGPMHLGSVYVERAKRG